MAEYIKYRGKQIYLGVCQSLIRTSYPKYVNALESGGLMMVEGNDYPHGYADPKHNYFYRFPFPDESALPFGEIKGEDYRGLPITIERGEQFEKEMFEDMRRTTRQYRSGRNPNCRREKVTIHIAFQRFITIGENPLFALGLMVRCPYSHGLWTLRSLEGIDFLIGQIQQYYILPAKQERQKVFWEEVVDIILKGYEPLRAHGTPSPIV